MSYDQFNVPPRSDGVVLPTVPAYEVEFHHGQHRYLLICPFCSGMHVHGIGGADTRVPHCGPERPAGSYYRLQPSGAAPDWMIEWQSADFRSLAADALAATRGEYVPLEKLIDLALKALRLYPSFAEHVAVLVIDQGRSEPEAELTVLRQMTRAKRKGSMREAVCAILRGLA